ncbi:MAG: sugar ABC transporter permease [Firmicutes bacterium]|nr:sugar ABC transporter permease [Bacillota bacterium]
MKKQQLWRLQEKAAPYIFIAPFFLSFFVFMAYPIVFNFRLCFTEWMGVGPFRYVGLANFTRLLTDVAFRRAVANSSFYAFGTILVVLPVALALAIMMNSPELRYQTFFKSGFFLPSVTPVIVVSIVFLLIYNEDYGLLNYVLRRVNLIERPVPWVNSTSLVKPAILILILWRWAGYNMVYYLAGLAGIPKDFLEAATVDGATRWQVFWHITLPLLKPTIIFTVTTSLIGSYQIFTEPYIMTDGGPSFASISLVQVIYRTGFQQLEFGRAAAMSLVVFIIIFGLSFLQMRWLRVWEDWE